MRYFIADAIVRGIMALFCVVSLVLGLCHPTGSDIRSFWLTACLVTVGVAFLWGFMMTPILTAIGREKIRRTMKEKEAVAERTGVER